MKSILFSFVLVFILSTCTKDQDVIPNIVVDVTINIHQPAYVNLTPVGGWVYVNGGLKGIVVYKKGPDEYAAYERNCPYQPSNKCAVIVESSNIIAIDSCCGSRFQLTDGIVIKGPASRGLKQYTSTYNSNNGDLHIYNY